MYMCALTLCAHVCISEKRRVVWWACSTPVGTVSKYCSCGFLNPGYTFESPRKLKNTDTGALKVKISLHGSGNRNDT